MRKKSGIAATSLLFLQLAVFAFQAPAETSISGRVTGPTGQPLVGMQVWLFRPELDLKAQKLLWQPVTTVTTNDRGEYRHFGMPEGRYYIGSGSITPAMAPGAVAMINRRTLAAGVSTETRRYATAFYPGTPEAVKAAPIDVKAGSDIKGVDLALPVLRTFTIRGRFVHEGSAISASAQVESFVCARYRDPAVTQQAACGGMRIAPNAQNAFEITDVPPGRYWVSVYISAVTGTPPTPPRARPGEAALTPEQQAEQRQQMQAFLSSPAVRSLRGVAAIDVMDSDVNGLVVECRLATPVEGRLTMEGQDWASLQGRDGVKISINVPTHGIQPEANLPSMPMAQVLGDGSFRFPTVNPWDNYRLFVADLPGDVYVKAVRVGSRYVLGKAFELVGATSDRIEVLLGNTGGRIEGNSSPNAAVVLVPPAKFERPDLFRTATADASGRFTLRGLAPGAYTLFAFERPTDSYLALERAGTVVQVTESSRATVNVPLSR